MLYKLKKRHLREQPGKSTHLYPNNFISALGRTRNLLLKSHCLVEELALEGRHGVEGTVEKSLARLSTHQRGRRIMGLLLCKTLNG